MRNVRDLLWSASALCSLPDNTCDGYRAVGPHLDEHPGAEVLIVGGAAASIGLYAAALTRALGSARVRYVDRDEERGAPTRDEHAPLGGGVYLLANDPVAPWLEACAASLRSFNPSVRVV